MTKARSQSNKERHIKLKQGHWLFKPKNVKKIDAKTLENVPTPNNYTVPLYFYSQTFI